MHGICLKKSILESKTNRKIDIQKYCLSLI